MRKKFWPWKMITNTSVNVNVCIGMMCMCMCVVHNMIMVPYAVKKVIAIMQSKSSSTYKITKKSICIIILRCSNSITLYRWIIIHILQIIYPVSSYSFLHFLFFPHSVDIDIKFKNTTKQKTHACNYHVLS